MEAVLRYAKAVFLVWVVIMAAGFEHWSGDRPIGRLERLAYERHERDLKEGAARGLWFDEGAAARYCDFFPKYLRHVEGEWAGKPFYLMPWERFVISSIYGWATLPEGWAPEDALGRFGSEPATAKGMRERHALGIFRRFRSGYIEVPKKSGKSPLAAGIGLVGLVYDGEPGAKIVTAATKRDQARIIFRLACAMARKSVELRSRLIIGRQAINLKSEPETSAFYPISAEARTEDGQNIHVALADEIHRHRDATLLNLLEESTSSRRQPLMFQITTAGDGQPGVWRDVHEYNVSVLDGTIANDRSFAFICKAEKADQWDADETILKANPSYGVTVKPEAVDDMISKARASRTALSDFKRYRLNIPQSDIIRWGNLDAWAKCVSKFSLKSLRNRPCYAGLDLSKTTDLTALALVFPPYNADKYWRLVTRFWTPEASMVERAYIDRVPYPTWADQGFLTPTPGAVVDYAYVKEDVLKLAQNYQGMMLGFDPYNATMFYTELMEEGFRNIIEVRQGEKTLNDPFKHFERLVLTGELKHDGNPVMTWCFGNIVCSMKPNGNMLPDKAKSIERIDGVSATITALAVAMAGGGIIIRADEYMSLTGA